MRTVHALVCASICTVFACNGTSPAPGTGSSSVAGRIVLQGESDHSGVSVTLSGPVMRATRTDAQGAYLFDNLPAGSYAVVATARSTREASQVTTVGVEAAKRALAADLTFLPLGQISGKVTYGTANGNAGIVVAVAGSSAVAVTDDLGRYTLTGVPTGAHDVVASAAGYGNASAPGVQVKYAAEVPAPELSLTRSTHPGKLAGKATIADQATSAGIVVTLTGPTSAVAVTADDGTWSVSDLAAGQYVATAAAPFTLEGSVSQAAAVINELKNLPPVTFSPAGAVSGTVTLEGQPGAGVLVFLQGGAATFSDSEGAFTLRGVPAHTVILQAMRVGYDVAASAPVAVPFGGTAAAVAIDLHRSATPGEAILGSSISLVGGVPADGVSVQLCDGENAASGVAGACNPHGSQTTPDGGAYSFGALTDGVYALDFSKGPYMETIPAAVALPGSRGLVADELLYPLSPIELQRGARIRSVHTVVDESPSPDGRIAYFTDTACQNVNFGQTAALIPEGGGGLACSGPAVGTLEVATAGVGYRELATDAVVGTVQWSPKGDAVLYAAKLNPFTGNEPSMHVVCPNGTDLDVGSQSTSWGLPALAWSHDAKTLAWIGPQGSLFALDLGSCAVATLETGVTGSVPAFNAADDLIFYMRPQQLAAATAAGNTGPNSLYAVPRAGGDEVLVTTGLSSFQLMNGNVTGEYLAFMADSASLYTQVLPPGAGAPVFLASNVLFFLSRSTGDLLVAHDWSSTGYIIDYMSALDGAFYQQVGSGISDVRSSDGDNYAFTSYDAEMQVTTLYAAQPGVAENGSPAYIVTQVTSDPLEQWQLSGFNSSLVYVTRTLGPQENTVYTAVVATVENGNVTQYPMGAQDAPPSQIGISSNGRFAGYVASSGALQLFGVDNESLVSLGSHVQGFGYSNEGHVLAQDLADDGKSALLVATADGKFACPAIPDVAPQTFQLSPRGHTVLFETGVVTPRFDKEPRGLLQALSLESCSPIALVSSASRGAFLDDGQAYAVRIDSASPYRFQDGIYYSAVPVPAPR